MSSKTATPSKTGLDYLQRRCDPIPINDSDESREQGDETTNHRQQRRQHPEQRSIRSPIDPPGCRRGNHDRSISSVDDDDDEQQRERVLPKISFDDSVTVRWYNSVLGDNPSVRHGPPVSLGWVFTEETDHLAGGRVSMEVPCSGLGCYYGSSCCYGDGDVNGSTDHHRTVELASKINRNKISSCYLDTTTRVRRLHRNGVTVQEMKDTMTEIHSLKSLRGRDAAASKAQREQQHRTTSNIPSSVSNANTRKRSLSAKNHFNDDDGGSYDAGPSARGLPRTKSDGGLQPWSFRSNRPQPQPQKHQNLPWVATHWWQPSQPQHRYREPPPPSPETRYIGFGTTATTTTLPLPQRPLPVCTPPSAFVQPSLLRLPPFPLPRRPSLAVPPLESLPSAWRPHF